ncbi:MAG: 16S rRNA methyltransferase [Promethearchaeota archaeon]
MPITLILAECGIELIPKELRANPKIKHLVRTKNYASQLLDNALHHHAMENLQNKEKRGRPDILHVCLLNALSSPLNKSGNLRIIVHTIKNKIFEFNPHIRIARNYNRFKGLIAKLLIDGKIQVNNSPLIAPLKGSLKSLLASIKNAHVMTCTKHGTLIKDLSTLFTPNPQINHVIIIGAFQKRTFSPEILNLTPNLISISNYSLDAWAVVNKIIASYEIFHNIY